MIIWYICIGVLLSICNALMIKRMNLKKYIYYIIGAIVLNMAYMITTICIAPITILSLFEFFSINMLMYLAICDMNEGEMYVVAFAIYAAVGVVASFFGSFISVILFSVVVFGILFLMHKKSKNGMGMGDVYAISCMSLFCNISEAMSIVMFSLLLSLIYGLLYSLFKRVSGKTVMIKYVPFLFIVTYLMKIIY